VPCPLSIVDSAMTNSAMTDSAMTAAPATEPFVTATTENGVLWLTLNRPQRRNPLSTEMIAALSQSIAAGNQDPAVKVMVIAGSGPAFSAGHDLAEIQRRADEEHTAWQARVQQLLAACAALMNSILHSPKAIIASVQGIASAAGCQLVSACDLAIASDEATFCTPGVNIGVFCTTPLVGIGRNLSRKHALEMALTGEQFDAATAERFGLINRHVPASSLHTATSSLAEKIASRSPESIARGKSTFYRQVEMPLDEAFALANQVMLDNLTSEGDAKEGVDAFFGKRAPQWGE
jgi:enoyl-CoA hydratase/carnithine racemase